MVDTTVEIISGNIRCCRLHHQKQKGVETMGTENLLILGAKYGHLWLINEAIMKRG